MLVPLKTLVQHKSDQRDFIPKKDSVSGLHKALSHFGNVPEIGLNYAK